MTTCPDARPAADHALMRVARIDALALAGLRETFHDEPDYVGD